MKKSIFYFLSFIIFYLFAFGTVDVQAQKISKKNPLLQINSAKKIVRQVDLKEAIQPVQNIYLINDTILFRLMDQSGNQLQMVIFYTDWCKSCSKEMPLIKRIGSDAPITVYFIEPDPLKYAHLIRNYLNNIGINQPTFMLSEAYKGNVRKRFYKFRDQICPNCNDVSGFPSIILMNKRREILYKKTGAINIDTLQKIINFKPIRSLNSLR